jgi:hypothetical protein
MRRLGCLPTPPSKEEETVPNEKSPALLHVQMDIAAEHEDELNHWYWREHLPERVVVDGVLGGRRFESAEGTAPKYLALYDLDDKSVLETPEYLRLVSPPDPRTLEIGRMLNSNIRRVYVEILPPSEGSNASETVVFGGLASDAQASSDKRPALLMVEMDIAPEHEAELNAWYWDEHVPERLACPGFLSARRFQLEGLGAPKYLALYGLHDISALHSPEYRHAIEHGTPRTKNIGKLATITRTEWVEIFAANP